ncbi:3-phosphoserine/phosphohydroxythreonine transaminase [Wenzhouxiangella sp. XN201]|uniref:3-phosphoserine/phosphohydroxythreonine transaminase n=1 Tax=Wenzhouxiangella sp. XN201 TaxID=2710755 RepID=UPI0013CDAD63|nr:3-phosphoserine/phosphohydroxythreonine transaminase [Wenzhouxiangella sp. XN201]NEZ03474.1 3-phosphoserine/phosphohydroxythreonine transaminase [Wenzhouxiangella sp. XN201]
MAHSIHNFSAGPAMLPVEVRERLADALAPSGDGAPSIAEISHRGPRFTALAEELHQRLRELTGIGEEHAVLLLHGGANGQFAQLPMNLAVDRTAAFLISGHWGKKALAEAERVARTQVVGSSEDSGFTDLPEMGHLPSDCAYLHYTGNETIHGLQYEQPPQAAVPLAADLSSEFLSRPYPYRDIALTYAGAQKNLGIAGLTVVLIRHDLLERVPDTLPRFLDYRTWVKDLSLYNTPASLAWFTALEMLRWIEHRGGLEVIAERNRVKAETLYRAIDDSDFWSNPVAEHCRSVMNVPFWPADEALVPDFVEAAEASGLYGLKGHRALGGLRASLYNAQTLDAVETLVDFMREFERRYG